MYAKGKVVRVYEDPITERRLEGRAVIVSQGLHDDIDQIGEYQVRFIDRDGRKEANSYQRLIKDGQS